MRELLQQAREALMAADRDSDYPLIAALDAALSQPQLSDEQIDALWRECMGAPVPYRSLARAVLAAAPQPAPATQEPLCPTITNFVSGGHLDSALVYARGFRAGQAAGATIPESAVLHRMKYHHRPAEDDCAEDFDLYEMNVACAGCIDVLIVRADVGVPS